MKKQGSERPMNRADRFVTVSSTIALLLALGCAGVKQTSSSGTSGSTGTGNATGLGGFGGTGMMVIPCNGPNGLCTDFKDPIKMGSVPGNVDSIFGSAGTGSAGGPCLIEPQDNSLFPNNWLRPRFRFTAGQGLYEIRLHAANQANDLVVYTTDTTWTLDKPTWTALALHTRDMPIAVTVRSAPPGGGSVLASTTVHFTIAPVGAAGKLVYWSTSGTT